MGVDNADQFVMNGSENISWYNLVDYCWNIVDNIPTESDKNTVQHINEQFYTVYRAELDKFNGSFSTPNDHNITFLSNEDMVRFILTWG